MDASADFATAPADDARRQAFRAAARNTGRVRFLKRAILVGSMLAIGGILVTFLFDPFGKLPANLSVSKAGINGSRITMELPKLSGFRKDGRPYNVTARSATQDIRKPTIIELADIDARIGLSDKGTAHVSAESGTYDSQHEVMELRNDVRMRSDAGYEAILKSASIDFRSGGLVTNDPVSVVMRGGNTTADSMKVSDGGSSIIFEGSVHSLFQPPEADDTRKDDTP